MQSGVQDLAAEEFPLFIMVLYILHSFFSQQNCQTPSRTENNFLVLKTTAVNSWHTKNRRQMMNINKSHSWGNNNTPSVEALSLNRRMTDPIVMLWPVKENVTCGRNINIAGAIQQFTQWGGWRRQCLAVFHLSPG